MITDETVEKWKARKLAKDLDSTKAHELFTLFEYLAGGGRLIDADKEMRASMEAVKVSAKDMTDAESEDKGVEWKESELGKYF